MSDVEIMSVNNAVDEQDETEYISSSPAMMKILEKGDKEIAEGKGTKINLEDLWKSQRKMVEKNYGRAQTGLQCQ